MHYLPQQTLLMKNVPNCTPFLAILITRGVLLILAVDISNFDSRNPSVSIEDRYTDESNIVRISLSFKDQV